MDGPPPGLATALDAYLAHLTVERGLSRNTLAAYRRDLGRYLDFLAAAGRTAPDQVTESDVEDYLTAIRTGADGRAILSAASAARAVVAARGWHKFCVLEGLAPGDPARGVRPPRQAQRLPKAISTEEVERLLDAASLGEGPLPLRDRALLELLYSTGARISEAVGLDVDDLDLTPGRAAVRLFGKGRKERVVPVGAYAVEAVEAYLVRARPVLAAAGRGGSRVFLNTRGGPLSRQSAWAVLHTAAQRAGLPASVHVSPHTLRHSFATHLLAGGADVRVVQELLGHASVTTTQIYTKVTPDTLREVYATSHPRARRQRV
ncbi:site-specific tyrosine recombinase XerD [Cellulomonas denverensis]|uniref:site-specific tyrosine recombinase XerD n=1 Tax=Cellulomonas denverensis TaxID=264297 RepID=UPI001944644C|nr:site-specific tyrosine recombinase XerD [Cellulomonas denverensis]GIG26165.1 tyrosine recombinase XerD [Cellulomonas denverensis]